MNDQQQHLAGTIFVGWLALVMGLVTLLMVIEGVAGALR